MIAQKIWEKQFGILLKEVLNMTPEDTGITLAGFYERFGDFGDVLPMDALETYAIKYDLEINHD